MALPVFLGLYLLFIFFSIECDCDPDGIDPEYPDCDMFTDEFEGTSAGQCHCKENVGGVRCDGCKNGYWNFTLLNELGCQGKSHLILYYLLIRLNIKS